MVTVRTIAPAGDRAAPRRARAVRTRARRTNPYTMRRPTHFALQRVPPGPSSRRPSAPDRSRSTRSSRHKNNIASTSSWLVNPSRDTPSAPAHATSPASSPIADARIASAAARRRSGRTSDDDHESGCGTAASRERTCTDQRLDSPPSARSPAPERDDRMKTSSRKTPAKLTRRRTPSGILRSGVRPPTHLLRGRTNASTGDRR